MSESKPRGGVNECAIAERAYRRWVSRGCPIGDGREDWFAAEAELQEAGEPRVARTALRRLNHAAT